LSRLSQWQWLLTVKDLLKLPDLGGLETQLTKDAVVNFDNEADALRVGQDLRSDLETVSEKLAQRVVSDSAALARIMPANAPTTLPEKARAFITSFGLRAYRRPLEASDIDEAVALFNQGPALFPGMDPFLAGVELVIDYFLQSPHFLYRTELSTGIVDAKVKACAIGDMRTGDRLERESTRFEMNAADRMHRRVIPLIWVAASGLVPFCHGAPHPLASSLNGYATPWLRRALARTPGWADCSILTATRAEGRCGRLTARSTKASDDCVV
jgi:hypothetical protein